MQHQIHERKAVFYTNHVRKNMTTDTVDATVDVNYNQPLFEKGSDYHVWVDRLVYHMNGIPFFPLPDPDDANAITPGVGYLLEADYVPTAPQPLYSMAEVVDFIQTTDPTMHVQYLPGGFIKIFSSHNAGFKVCPELGRLLDIAANPTIFLNPVKSSTPRTDLDDIVGLHLDTTIPIASEISSDGSTRQTLIDLSGPSPPMSIVDTNFKADTWTSFPRQKIVYNAPKNKRLVNILTDGPVYAFRLSLKLLNIKGQTLQATVPPGCLFSVKLGWQKKQ